MCGFEEPAPSHASFAGGSPPHNRLTDTNYCRRHTDANTDATSFQHLHRCKDTPLPTTTISGIATTIAAIATITTVTVTVNIRVTVKVTDTVTVAVAAAVAVTITATTTVTVSV